MMENTAFLSGIFVTLTSVLYVLLTWIIALIFKLKINQASFLFPTYFHLLKKRIQHTEVLLGWLPLGSYLKISGMAPLEEGQVLQPYDFQSKSALQRLLTVLTGPSIITVTGLILLLQNTSVSFSQVMDTYIQNATFKLSIDESESIWNIVFSTPLALMGLLFFLFGISTFITNLGTFFANLQNTKLFISFIFQIIGLLVVLPILLMAVHYFTFMNLLYFVLASLITGFLGWVVGLLMVKSG